MNFWMHGLGDNPTENAKTLKQLGFSAVVASDMSSLNATQDSGLDFYWCSGAFSHSGSFASDEYLAVDINGKRREWFGSTCPSKKDVRQRNLHDIAEISKISGIKGILIDGARFSSPASANSIDSFYTCFCSDCMNEATAMGFDTIKMKASVKALYDICHYGKSSIGFSEQHLSGICDWLNFRKKSITKHLKDYVKTIKSVNSNLLAGAYLFSPSLSYLVGQSYLDLSDDIDIFSPMIYRAYKEDSGPACLNFEFEALIKELGFALGNNRALELVRGMSGLDIPKNTIEGLPVSAVENEVKNSFVLSDTASCIPIIQLNDPLLHDSIKTCKNAGADTVNFFVWNDKLLNNPDFVSIFNRKDYI